MTTDVKVYVKGDAFIPSLFWSYVLIENDVQEYDLQDYIDKGFVFSQTRTDYFSSLTEKERQKFIKNI